MKLSGIEMSYTWPAAGMARISLASQTLSILQHWSFQCAARAYTKSDWRRGMERYDLWD